MENKINVLHLTFDMRIGGTEQVIKNLVSNVDHDRINASILCIEEPIGPFGLQLIDKGIRINSFQRKGGFNVQLIIKIRAFIKDNNIDVLHCHQYTPWVYGVFSSIFTKTLVIFTEHGRFYPDSSTWKRKLINPILSIFTAYTTAISKATKDALVEYENIPEKAINVVYNGIYPLEIKPKAVISLKKSLLIPDTHKVIGTIARFDMIKNHIMMLKAFSQVLKTYTNVMLIIVGDGDERSNIEACIKKLKLTENVILTGYKKEPENYLALMDIYLLSSFSEGTSMTLLEAMSIGKPMVVTDAGGNSEVVKHGYNGYVTKNDDAEHFAKSIEKLLVAPKLKVKYGLNSNKRFQEFFDVSKMTTQYETMYSGKLK